MKELADRLQEIQKQRKMTRKEMAEQIGVMPASLSSYMNNVTTPTLDIVKKIAQALGVSAGWLCGEDQGPAPMVTYADFLRQLVALVDGSGVQLRVLQERVPLDAARRGAYFQDEGIWSMRVAEALDCQEDPNTMDVAVIESPDRGIVNFVADWCRIRELHQSGTIDEEMYDAWLEKRFRSAGADTALPFKNALA